MPSKKIILPKAYLCFEVSVALDTKELAYAILDHLTGMPISETQIPKKNKVKLTLYFSKNKNLQQIKNNFKKQFRQKCSIKIFLLDDWKDKWKRDFHARKVTSQLWICPSWEKVKIKSNEKVIYLEPGVAFGTGLHPTTKFVLKMIDKFHSQIGSLADLGTGTGILSIGANALGIKKIVAIDNDLQAIYAARDNFKKNKCKNIKLKKVALEKFKTKQKFDFVAANIETKILLKSKTKLMSLLQQGGHLALTGIGAKSRDEVLRHYKSKKLHLVDQFKSREWAGFCFKNKI